MSHSATDWIDGGQRISRADIKAAHLYQRSPKLMGPIQGAWVRAKELLVGAMLTNESVDFASFRRLRGRLQFVTDWERHDQIVLREHLQIDGQTVATIELAFESCAYRVRVAVLDRDAFARPGLLDQEAE